MKKFKINLILGSIFLVFLTVIGVIFFHRSQKTPRIVKAKSGDNLYITQNTSFKAGFGVKDDPSKIVFHTGKQSLTFNLPYNDIKWQKEEDTLIASVSDSLAFSYTLLDFKGESHGLKEDIVLKKPPFKEESGDDQSSLNVQNKFEFTLDLNGLTPKRDAEGLWHFYDEQGEDLFYIPHPYMEDSAGVRSEAVQLDITKDSLIVEVDREWLLPPERKYPIIIDPTFKLTILTVHSHPQQGDDWVVEFTTQGKADLTITPDDQATIDDIDFVSLTCNGEEKQPQILENDVIYYQDWECDNTAKLTHLVNTAAPHRLKFQFGDEVDYAYNAPGSTISSCGDTLEYGGNCYSTLEIGSQCWLGENLNIDPSSADNASITC